MTVIKYDEGTGKENRASFVCGKASLQTAMFTRIRKELEGKSDTAKARIFIAKLFPKHSEFLDALEKAEISCLDAITKMIELTPSPRKTELRISKEAIAVAKMLCRKYAKKTPDEMFSAFTETMSRPEFKALVIELVNESEKKFGRNAQDRIRVRAERKDLVANAEKARAGRKKKS